jgi:hypothetical protein
MPHHATEIAARGLQQEMVMVPHQAVPMDYQPKAFVCLGQSFEKRVIIGESVKDRLSLSPAIHHVITRLRVFDADRAGHGKTLNEIISLIKQPDPIFKQPDPL